MTSVLFVILLTKWDMDRVNQLKRLWLDRSPYPFIFTICDPEVPETYLDGRILWVNNPEQYEQLPVKMWKTYHYLYHHTDYQYFYKLDSDCILHLDRFKHFFQKAQSYYYLGGVAGGGVDRTWHMGKCSSEELNRTPYWRDYRGDWCGGGFGYLVSRTAIQHLFSPEGRHYMTTDIYEDKAVGDILRQNGIQPQFELSANLYRMEPYKGSLSWEDYPEDTMVIYDAGT